MIATLQRMSGREMLINADTADQFLSNLTRMSGVQQAEIAGLEATSREQLCLAYGIDDPRDTNDRKPFVYQDGIAVIPVHGTLINRFNSSWGFVTGYNFIRRQLNLILDDEDVETMIFDVDSPGGEASGCFELAREILASRRVKASLAMVDSLAASGGMALAGAATKMYAIPSARIGSIGVYRQHVSVEGALERDGVKVTFAVAGDHKIDGNPYAALPDSVLKDWTTDANKTWEDFIDLVAEARGLEPAAVRETQARIYRADEALALGLINAVKTTTEAVPAFVAEMADSEPLDEEEDEMTEATTKGKGAEVASVVDYDKIGAMIGTAVSSAIGGLTRSQNITAHGKAKGQAALGAKLAANEAISEADAIEMIDAASGKVAPIGELPMKKKKGKTAKAGDPADEDDDDDADEDDDGDEDGEDDDGDEDGEEQARSRRQRQNVGGRRQRGDNVNHFDRAMRGTRQPKVGSGDGDGEKLTGDAAATAQLLGDYAAHTGNDLRKKNAA
jgi:signal peptide peptidase SppA